MLRVRLLCAATIVMLLPLLLACTPTAGDEPVAGPENSEEAEGQERAISTPVPESSDAEKDTSPDAVTKPDTLRAGDAEEDASQAQQPSSSTEGETIEGPAVEPVEVDLGHLTPVPLPEGGEPVVQPQPGSPDAAQMMAHRSRMDLAERLGIDVEDVEVVSVEEVQWPDSSLGCPQPGMSYLMVITPGFRVVLEAEEKTYQYHTDTKQNVVLCENPRPGAMPGPADQ